jgi:hypothetical protein
MKTVNLLFVLVIFGLFCSCGDFFHADQPSPGHVSLNSLLKNSPNWSAIPAPADGLQVMLDPVIIPEKPEFLSLYLP